MGPSLGILQGFDKKRAACLVGGDFTCKIPVEVPCRLVLSKFPCRPNMLVLKFISKFPCRPIKCAGIHTKLSHYVGTSFLSARFWPPVPTNPDLHSEILFAQRPIQPDGSFFNR